MYQITLNLATYTGGYLKRMADTISWGSKEYKVYSKPTKHIRIDAFENKPSISARWNVKSDNPPKACTCDMIHLTPYKGCTINCSFCSLPRTRGFGILKSRDGISVVFENYDAYVDEQISKCNFLHTFDFGADADAFMDLNRRYHMTEKTMQVLNKWGLPFSVTTKGVFTDWAVEELSKNPHSWAQMSIVTTDEELRKQIILGSDGATVEQIKDNVRRLKEAGVHITARVQPYIHGLSEKPERLIASIADMGFDSVVFGFMRAPMGAGKKLLDYYGELSQKDFTKLYTTKTPGYWQIPDSLALKILERVRNACDKYKLPLGLCDVYIKDGDGQYKSLQREFGTCRACETVNAYGYRRNGNKFERVKKCIGNCLYCKNSSCGHPQFYTSVKYTIKDYAKLKTGDET